MTTQNKNTGRKSNRSSAYNNNNNKRRKGSKRKRQRQREFIKNISILVLIIVFCIIFVFFWTKYLDKIRSKDSSETITPIINNGDIELPASEEEASEEQDNYLMTVCIDPGHGGKDNGGNRGSHYEKDDDLEIGLALRDYLETQNVRIVMTRDDDTFLKLSARCRFSNYHKADYLISLHRNTGNGNGIESWISTQASDENKYMADKIMENLVNVGVSRDRGVSTGSASNHSEDYYINGFSNAPSVILELGFMNNSEDNNLLKEHLEEYAKAIGDALIDTYNQKLQGAFPPKPLEDTTAVDDAIKDDISENADSSNETDSASIDSSLETESTEGETSSDENASNDASSSDNNNASASYVPGNQPVLDLTGLDTTSLGWGQGVQFDNLNRPGGALSYQDKYGKYNAYFIDSSTTDKVIYLTFDEGYEYGCSGRILDTLKEKNVQAVFFITKPYAEKNPDLVSRMINEGQQLGNHSVTHPSEGLPSQSLDQQKQEIMGCDQYIKDNFNYQMHLFRYPAGKFSEQSLALVNNCQYKSVFWSFAYLDYDVNNQPSQSDSLKKLVDRLHPGAIYLLHAESETNTAILGSFIDQARDQGYTFKMLQ